VAQSQYGKAEEMFKFCLKCRKETLGIDHDDTVTLMYSLGDIYIAQGAFDKAEVLYDDFWNNVKGMNPNSLKTLASMSVLADLYFKRGDMHKAELFYTLVLDRRRQLLGDFNNETLSSMCGLASVYNTKGDYVRAEKLFKECAEKRVALLGPTHEATLAIFGILAKFYQERGEYESAEKYFDLLYAAKTPIY
jgi:tetratricopeptide (TPR) repeat protein